MKEEDFKLQSEIYNAVSHRALNWPKSISECHDISLPSGCAWKQTEKQGLVITNFSTVVMSELTIFLNYKCETIH